MKYCFIFPHAGALRSDYNNLEKSLGAYFKCIYFSREKINSSGWQESIESSFEFIKNYLESSDNEYIIIGHSMGAMQAYYTSCLLDKFGFRKASLVILSSMYAPTLNNISDLQSLISINENDFSNEIIKLGGIPSQILKRKDLLAFFMARIKDDIDKIKGIAQSQTKLKSRVICLAGANDKKYSFVKMNEWSEYTNQPLEIKVFDGGHFYLINLYQEVADYINEILARNSDEL